MGVGYRNGEEKARPYLVPLPCIFVLQFTLKSNRRLKHFLKTEENNSSFEYVEIACVIIFHVLLTKLFKMIIDHEICYVL